jgi:parallel beta-helix repeat protein
MRRLLAWLVLGILVCGLAVAIVAAPDGARAYSLHDPITISGNAGFTLENGVTGGSGTESDPYIIEGWEIEVFATTGISVTGTDAWFVIRGVHIFNSNETSSTGIGLWDVQNGRVEDSNLLGMQADIDITASSNVIVTGCNFTSYGYGVYVLGSSGVTVSRCNITGYDYFGVGASQCTNIRLEYNNVTDMGTGMSVYDCTSVEILNNTIARSWYKGLELGRCTGISVHNNTFISDGITLTGTTVAHYDSHDITTDNLVNGKPLYYVSNQADVSFNGEPVGQLILADSTRVSIWNLVIDDTDAGIQVAYCSIVWIYYCHVSKNPENGISMIESDTITVTGCTISDNMYGGGLSFVGCAKLYLDWNKIYDSGRGIYLESSGEAYISNSIIQNQSGWIHWSHGICVYESFNVTMNLNLIEGFDMGVWGYHAWYWSPPGYVWLYNSTIGNCTDGVRFQSSAHVAIADNVIWACDSGIVADSSSDMTIVRNVIADNGKGLDIKGGMSYLTWVFYNNFINNTVQASDSSMGNYWDLGYPGGGNYWSDYSGVDLMYGPSQDLPGPDSLGDTPRIVTGAIADNYPLMMPYPTNRPPIASFTVTPGTGDVETVFSFDASASWDFESLPPCTSLIEVRWDWESDGVWDTDWSTELTATHQFPAPGTYDVTLEVRDFNWSVSQKTVEVVVTDVIPEFGDVLLPILLTLVAFVAALRVRTGRRAS